MHLYSPVERKSLSLIQKKNLLLSQIAGLWFFVVLFRENWTRSDSLSEAMLPQLHAPMSNWYWGWARVPSTSMQRYADHRCTPHVYSSGHTDQHNKLTEHSHERKQHERLHPASLSGWTGWRLGSGNVHTYNMGGPTAGLRHPVCSAAGTWTYEPQRPHASMHAHGASWNCPGPQ